MDIKKEGQLLEKKIEHAFNSGKSKNDISILKLLNYNLLFFIPVMIFMIFALKIGSLYSDYFEASPSTIAKMFMVPFMMVIFFFIVPFIRRREEIVGVRYSIVAFMVIGFGLTLPSIFKGEYSILMTIINYFGSYILVTFIMCPDVLGIERNMRDWFKHGKQIYIFVICMAIVLLYVVGFGALYYDIYNDPMSPDAFTFSSDKQPTFATFVYFSMVSFATVGYGDILPVAAAARFVFFMEAMVGIIVNVLFIAILLLFVSNAEFLSQKAEGTKLVRKVEEEEQEIKKEEKEIASENKEIKGVKRKVEVIETETEEIKKKIDS